MKKLYKLKSWYTLTEAAARLSLTLDEPVTEDDIIQLAADGHITVSWFLNSSHGYLAQQVTVSSDYPREDYPFIRTEPVYDENGKAWGHYITGIFNLPVQLYPPWGWWLLTFLGKGGESGTGWDPIVVDTDDGAFWSFYATPDNGYFMHFPAREDVVVTRKDIETFENRVLHFDAESTAATRREEIGKGVPNFDSGKGWVTHAQELALHYIDRHRKATPPLFPSQQDVCDYLETELRNRKIYGVQGKPVSASYIGRNAIRGDWWKKNKP